MKQFRFHVHYLPHLAEWLSPSCYDDAMDIVQELTHLRFVKSFALTYNTIYRSFVQEVLNHEEEAQTEDDNCKQTQVEGDTKCEEEVEVKKPKCSYHYKLYKSEGDRFVVSCTTPHNKKETEKRLKHA